MYRLGLHIYYNLHILDVIILNYILDVTYQLLSGHHIVDRCRQFKCSTAAYARRTAGELLVQLTLWPDLAVHTFDPTTC